MSSFLDSVNKNINNSLKPVSSIIICLLLSIISLLRFSLILILSLPLSLPYTRMHAQIQI